MSRVEQAVACFNSGFNCSQAMLSTYGDAFALQRDIALKLATGFGGGMRMGGVCGAVTGAFMVLGLKFGPTRPDDVEARELAYNLVLEFSRRFSARNRSIVCKDLLGCDIGTPEGLAMAKDTGLFKTICPKMVREAAEILEQMLNAKPG